MLSYCIIGTHPIILSGDARSFPAMVGEKHTYCERTRNGYDSEAEYTSAAKTCGIGYNTLLSPASFSMPGAGATAFSISHSLRF